MFNSVQRSHLSTAQRAKTNQENEGIQLTNNKGMALNQFRFPGTSKIFGDVKNKLDSKSTTSLGIFANNKNSPFPTEVSKKTVQHELLKPQKVQFHEGMFPKSSPFATPSSKRNIQHEISNKNIYFHEDNDEFSLDIDSLLDSFPIPKPKPDNYGYTSNLFDFTDDEINDNLFQKIDECQESPKLYNDDFHLREIPMPSRILSFEEDLPLCMTPDWESGNNSILDLVGDNSCNSFASNEAETMHEDELPDFFSFKFD